MVGASTFVFVQTKDASIEVALKGDLFWYVDGGRSLMSTSLFQLVMPSHADLRAAKREIGRLAGAGESTFLFKLQVPK